MNQRRMMILAACACFVMAVAPAAAEDLTIVYKTSGPGGAGTSTSYFSSDRMRTADTERDTIVEYGAGRIVTIDHKRKEYSETTIAELEAAMKAAAQKMQAANEQMANMPPAMREKMQQMMGGGGTVAVTKGATKKVAGYDCQDYQIAAGAMMSVHVCATTAIAPPAAGADHRRFASLGAAAGALNPMMKDLAAEMQKIQGVSLAESSSMKMMGRSVETSKEATEVKKGAIAPAAFDVAALTRGYKKVASPTAQLAR